MTLRGLLLSCFALLPALAGLAAETAVHDETRLWRDEDRASLEQELATMERGTGVAIRIEALSFLDGRSTRDHAVLRAEEWIGAAPGLMICYVRGNGQTAVVPSPGLWKQFPTDEIAMLLTEAARQLADQSQPPDRRIGQVCRFITGRLGELEEHRKLTVTGFGAAEKKLFILVLLAGAAIVGIVIFARRRLRSESGASYRFPEITASTRLGASFGGGSIGQAPSQSGRR